MFADWPLVRFKTRARSRVAKIASLTLMALSFVTAAQRMADAGCDDSWLREIDELVEKTNGGSLTDDQVRKLSMWSPNHRINLPSNISIQLSWRAASARADAVHYPVIEGFTNLPNGTEVRAWVTKPFLPDAKERIARNESPCLISCTPADVEGIFLPNAKVQSGRFSIGPFSFGNAPFPPGRYQVAIYVPVGRLPCETTDQERGDRVMWSAKNPVVKGAIQIP